MTEQEFARSWWKCADFPRAPKFSSSASPITFTDALDPVDPFSQGDNAKWVMKVKEKRFLESWWQRRFSTAGPLKWDSFMASWKTLRIS